MKVNINLNNPASNFELYHLMRDKSFNQRLSWNNGVKLVRFLLLEGRPLSYILRNHFFLKSNLDINPGILVPRNETEEYIHFLIKKLSATITNGNEKFKILDLCSGSGCIALALGCSLRNVEITSIDKSYQCFLNMSQNLKLNTNILKNNNSEIYLKHVDIMSHTDLTNNEKFDLIISNPPYIQPIKKNKVEPNVLKFESHSALFPRTNSLKGLLFHLKILDLSKKILKPVDKNYEIPRIILEFDGKYQILTLRKMLQKFGYNDFIFKKDFSNNPRSLWVY